MPMLSVFGSTRNDKGNGVKKGQCCYWHSQFLQFLCLCLHFLSDPSPIILAMLVTIIHWLTDSLPFSKCDQLIDVTLACEDGNSKLVVTVWLWLSLTYTLVTLGQIKLSYMFAVSLPSCMWIRICEKHVACNRHWFGYLLLMCWNFPKWNGGDHSKQLWEESNSILRCVSWWRETSWRFSLRPGSF